MRFKIGSDIYEAQTLDRLTLREILRLESETSALGRPMKWSEIQAMGAEFDELTADQAALHDDAPWLIALVVWASRLRQGENLSFAEAVDFEIGDLDWLPDPQDHKAAANPQKPPKGSAGGAKRGTAKAAAKTSV